MVDHQDDLLSTADHRALDLRLVEGVVGRPCLDTDAGRTHESLADADIVQTGHSRQADKRFRLLIENTPRGQQVQFRIFLDFIENNQAVADDGDIFALRDVGQKMDRCRSRIDVNRLTIFDQTGRKTADVTLFVNSHGAARGKGNDVVLLVPEDAAVYLGDGTIFDQLLDVAPDGVQRDIEVVA